MSFVFQHRFKKKCKINIGFGCMILFNTTCRFIFDLVYTSNLKRWHKNVFMYI